MRNVSLALAFAFAFCAHVPPRPSGLISVGKLQNLYCVNHPSCTVYRSEQPSEADFIELQQKLGLKSVIKWNSAIEGRDRLPPGVELIDDYVLPAGPFAIGDDATCRRLHELVDDIDNAPKPMLGHCTLGDDRTGIIYGFWRLWTKTESVHPSPQAVWGEMIAHGFHDKLYPMLVDAFVDCSGYDPRKDGVM